MPHIHAILAADDAEVINILRKHKSKIRRVFAKQLKYKVKEVALITRLLTSPEVELSDNLDRIEFVVDTGALTPVPGVSAEFIRAELVEKVPKLDAIEFGIWMRKLGDNSYSKHTPSNR